MGGVRRARRHRWPTYRCRRCNGVFEATPEMRERYADPKARSNNNHRLRCPPCDEAVKHLVTNPDGPPKGVAGRTTPGSMYPMDRPKKGEAMSAPTKSEVKYPDVHVQLTGLDGNAFMLIGTVQKALRKHDGVPNEEASTFASEAMKLDSYDELLCFIQRWVTIH